MAKKDFPQNGWTYIKQIDTRTELRFKNKEVRCDYCNQETRYLHLISHPLCGVIGVGCVCADKLTGTNEASNRDREAVRSQARIETLSDKGKWRKGNGVWETEVEGYVVKIREDKGYRVSVMVEVDVGGDFPMYKWECIESKRTQATFEDAVSYAYNNIMNGALIRYLKRKR